MKNNNKYIFFKKYFEKQLNINKKISWNKKLECFFWRYCNYPTLVFFFFSLSLSLTQNRRQLVNQFGSSVPSPIAINRIVTLRSIQRVIYGWQGKAEMNDDTWMTAHGVGRLGPVIVNSSSIWSLYIYFLGNAPPFWGALTFLTVKNLVWRQIRKPHSHLETRRGGWILIVYNGAADLSVRHSRHVSRQREKT